MKLLTLREWFVPLLALAWLGWAQERAPIGYKDTPRLPDSDWLVHDADRPRPARVEPGQNGGPPSDALVLFDGSGLEHWAAGGGPAAWTLVDGAMEVNGSGSIESRQAFGDVQLHLEWMAPHEPDVTSQAKGNSGVFLMGRYEVQVLDSFANETYADGQAAALYGQFPPDVNACRPDRQWQSYDIVFRAPRFDGERLLEPALVTVIHNGVVVHHARKFLGATAHRAVAQYARHAERLPIVLQDHGNRVRYRNIWVRQL